MALTRMQQRRGPAAEWIDANTILASGEIGYETDTKKFKIGDGVTAWPSLPYFENEVDVAAAIQAAVDGILDLPPETLDTLNELAAALGDDPDFFNTVVYKAGSTMSGPLILSADPTQNLEAATKQYVDSIEPMEPGGTTGQALVKASNDDYDVQWTTVAFDLNGLSDVDTSGAVDKNTLVYEDTTGTWVAGPGGGRFTVSETPPVDVLNGDTWLDSTTGNSYLYYEDYDNPQWIQIAGPNAVGTAGGSLTIASTAPGTPVDGDLWYDPTEGFTYIYYRDADSSQWVQFGLNRNGAPGPAGADGVDGVDGADGADGDLTLAGLETYNNGNMATPLIPDTNSAYDLGSAEYKWRYLFTSDIVMSNEDMPNDVDGTWGSYVIQEGENDLFLLNKRNGKKYRFVIEEIN